MSIILKVLEGTAQSSWTDSIPLLHLLLSPFKIVPFRVYAIVSGLLPLLNALLELTFQLLVGCQAIVPDCSTEKTAVWFLCIFH